MLRPSVASEAKVKRRASAPNAGMPSGNSFLVLDSMRGASFGRRRPVVRFLSSGSSSMPSIRSTGSRVLPSDLLIFLPSESRTRPCTYTVWNGTWPVKCLVIMTMRATQKKMMS
ncbi:hypothetical protein D3C72_1705540 [compost metagenome]